MQQTSKIDWLLLWSVVKDHTTFFLILFVMGLVFGLVGGVILYNGFGELGAMFIGGLFALIGLAMFIAAFVTTYSSISYYYDLALLRKHGMNVDAVLTRKEAQCQFHQEYDHNNNPLGEGYHLCDLLVEFDFQYNGRNYSGAYYLGKADLFDKLREGDPLPLRVLRLDPTVHKVRERRLANMVKD